MMVRGPHGLRLHYPLSSWKGKQSCRCTKPEIHRDPSNDARAPKGIIKRDFELVIACERLGSIHMRPVILDEIRKAQSNDEFLIEIQERM